MIKKLTYSALVLGLLTGCNVETQEDSNLSGTGTSSSSSYQEKDLIISQEAKKTAERLLAVIEADGDLEKLKVMRVQIAAGKSPVDVESYMIGLITDAYANDEITLEDKEELLNSNLYLTFIEVMGSRDSGHENFRGLGSLLKDAINKLAATNAGQKLGGEAFKLVLDNDGLTVAMIDLARGSRTITDAMIDILGDDKNWNDVTPKMYPSLKNDREFGEKFAALAYEMNPETKDGAPNMGAFFFSKVDTGMLNALADAMIISDDSNFDGGVSMNTTQYMAKLIERHAKEFFIMPNTGVSADLNTASGKSYGKTDAFANLLFDTGINVARDENGTYSGHGDASEYALEKFFYAIFRNPESTLSFVKGMKQVNETNPEIIQLYMDKIFLGGDDNTSDVFQGYLNIEAVAGAFNEGIEKYGMSAYYSSIKGFYDLVPSDRFYPYAKAFMNAGFNYANLSISGIYGGVSGYVTGYFNEDNTTILPDANQSKSRSLGQGSYNTQWSTVIWDCSTAGWNDFSVWDTIKGYYSEDNSTNETNVSKVTFSSCLHDEIELSIREDLVNEQNLTIEQAEGNFTLPSFSDITFKYVYTGAYNRLYTTASFFYTDKVNDLSEWWNDYSILDSVTGAYNYTKDFVFGTSEERWAYFPNWLADTQWFDLKEYYSSSTSTLTIDFYKGYVDFYVISEDANLTETVKGLDVNLTRVETTDLPLSVQKDLNITEVKADEITEYYVYTTRVYSTTGLTEMLAKLEDYINGFGADTTEATQSTE